jgi:hypothetical protein
MVILAIFYHFGMLHHETSGNPGRWSHFTNDKSFSFFFIRPRFEWSPLFNDGRQKLFLERLKVEDCSSARDQCYENIFAEKI